MVVRSGSLSVPYSLAVAALSISSNSIIVGLSRGLCAIHHATVDLSETS